MDNLTNEAKFLLSSMYKIYLEKRQSGISREQALYFGYIEDIKTLILPNYLLDDVTHICFELLKYEFISGLKCDNSIEDIHLSLVAVAILETTFQDKINNVLDFLAKIKNAIPFV